MKDYCDDLLPTYIPGSFQFKIHAKVSKHSNFFFSFAPSDIGMTSEINKEAGLNVPMLKTGKNTGNKNVLKNRRERIYVCVCFVVVCLFFGT